MPIASPANYETLSAMITPALFMTANGSLIISTSNRMSRVVDRVRELNDQVDLMQRGKSDLDFLTERQEHVADQIRRLEWRSDRIRLALTVLYLAFGSFVGTSLTLALDTIFAGHLAVLPTSLAIIGVLGLLIACIQLLREAYAALLSSREEARFYRALAQTRTAAGNDDAAQAPPLVKN